MFPIKVCFDARVQFFCRIEIDDVGGGMAAREHAGTLGYIIRMFGMQLIKI